jgi:hypothetical protein
MREVHLMNLLLPGKKLSLENKHCRTKRAATVLNVKTVAVFLGIETE